MTRQARTPSSVSVVKSLLQMQNWSYMPESTPGRPHTSVQRCTSLRYLRRHMETCGEVLVTSIKKEVVEVEDEQLQQH